MPRRSSQRQQGQEIHIRHLLSLHLAALYRVLLQLCFQTCNQELTPLMYLMYIFLKKTLFQVLRKISSNAMSTRHFPFPGTPPPPKKNNLNNTLLQKKSLWCLETKTNLEFLSSWDVFPTNLLKSLKGKSIKCQDVERVIPVRH